MGNPIPCVTVYTDGSNWQLNGRYAGGYGCVLMSKDHPGRVKFVRGSCLPDINSSTYVELLAITMGLRTLRGQSQVLIRTDRFDFVDNWYKMFSTKTQKIAKSQGLFRETEKHTVRFELVKGHNGDRWNETCHDMAITAMRDAMHKDLVYHQEWYEGVE